MSALQNSVPVSRLRALERCACQQVWHASAGNAVHVSGFGVHRLESLCLIGIAWQKTPYLSPDFARIVQKSCAWCGSTGNAVPVSRFDVHRLETLRLSPDVGASNRNSVPVSGFGVHRLDALCLSTDLACISWKHCACERIWRAST